MRSDYSCACHRWINRLPIISRVSAKAFLFVRLQQRLKEEAPRVRLHVLDRKESNWNSINFEIRRVPLSETNLTYMYVDVQICIANLFRDWRKSNSTERAWFPQPVIQPTSPNRSIVVRCEGRRGLESRAACRCDSQLLTVESKRGGQRDSRERICATGAWWSAVFLRLFFIFPPFLSSFFFSFFFFFFLSSTGPVGERQKIGIDGKRGGEKATVPRGCRAVNGSPRQIGREQAARLAQISRHARNPEPICNAIYIYIYIYTYTHI